MCSPKSKTEVIQLKFLVAVPPKVRDLWNGLPTSTTSFAVSWIFKKRSDDSAFSFLEILCFVCISLYTRETCGGSLSIILWNALGVTIWCKECNNFFLYFNTNSSGRKCSEHYLLRSFATNVYCAFFDSINLINTLQKLVTETVQSINSSAASREPWSAKDK